MTHEWWLSSAECAECKRLTRAGLDWAAEAHLQAQKDAAYAAMEAAFGPEPIKYLLQEPGTEGDRAAELDRLMDALRAQREAMK